MRTLIFCDILRFILLIPLLSVTSNHQIGIVFGVAPLLSALGALFSCARRALLGSVLSSTDLAAGNSLMEMTDSLLTIVAPPLGVLLLTRWGFSSVIAINAASFLGSALLLMPLLRLDLTPISKGSSESKRPSFLKALQESIYLFRDSTCHARLMVFVSLLSLANGVLMVLNTVFALKYVELTEPQYARIVSLQGVGGIVGAFAFMKWIERPGLSRFWSLATGMTALSLGIAIVYPGFWTLAASTLIEGLFVTSIYVSLPVFLTQATHNELQGRAFASLDSVEQTFMAASMALAGAASGVFSVSAIYGAAVTVLLVASLTVCWP